MFLNGKSAGKESRNRKIIFDIHIRMPFRFDQANKKKSVIYALTMRPNGFMGRYMYISIAYSKSD